MKDKVASMIAALLVVVLLVALTVQAPADPRKNPLTIQNFRVEIDGVVMGSFKEVSGLRCETEVIESPHPDKTIHLTPGPTRCGPLILRRGMSEGPELWNWYQEVVNGNVERKSGSIIMYDGKGVEKMRYNFFEAWPAKWTGPTLDAGKSEIAIEEVLVVFEHGDWVGR